MSLFGIWLSDKGIVILLQRSPGIAAFDGFASFAMIDINGQIPAGVAIIAAIRAAATVYKKSSIVHGVAVWN